MISLFFLVCPTAKSKHLKRLHLHLPLLHYLESFVCEILCQILLFGLSRCGDKRCTVDTAKSFPQAGSCDSGTEAPTLFTVNTDFTNCAYKEIITLCQANALLTAAAGFDSYKWEKNLTDRKSVV